MAMNQTVNFLPWRRIQFYRDLRCWGLRVCGSWLVCGGMAFYASLYWQIDQKVSEHHVLAEQQIRQQMLLREQQLKSDAQERALDQKRLAMREVTRAWSQRLSALADNLPPQSWLNELTYRRGVLSLSGVLTQFSALSAVEQVLQSIPGFLPGKAGNIQRSSDGYWQFQYQLAEEMRHVVP
ncbi:PilN domain-containing protein [Kluyvera genomosp. 1]|uniref:PilN domain-containing protein n=1 Tax=Kluyvera genomosp. 1 TaxID=2774053 RepID=UPI00068F25E6|nr:PilN domain-containing protein [Kluyvera genomosp. 1]